MNKAKLIIGLALAGMTTVASLGAQADSASVNLRFRDVAVDLDFGPPPARVEIIPAPRAGYVWAPGFWRWEDHRHIWVPGTWMVARPGYAWVGERWVPGDRGWHFQPGYWAPQRVIREPVHRDWDADHWGYRDRDRGWDDRRWDHDRHDHWEHDADTRGPDYRGWDMRRPDNRGPAGDNGGWHAAPGRGRQRG